MKSARQNHPAVRTDDMMNSEDRLDRKLPSTGGSATRKVSTSRPAGGRDSAGFHGTRRDGRRCGSVRQRGPSDGRTAPIQPRIALGKRYSPSRRT